MYSLTKTCKLYRSQIEKFQADIFGDYRSNRISLDLDAMLFRAKYMIRNKLDLDKLSAMEYEFNKKSAELRECTSEFIYELLARVVGVPEPYKLENLIDVAITEMKMDQDYYTIDLLVISDERGYLEYIDKTIPEDKPYNIFPNEYFRFYTDSYNDAIAKTYPELFENKYQDKVGVGADRDVFCHNFTFQTTESCSLNCTYCYEFNKCLHRMKFSTAKKFIDNLLEDKYGYLNRYNSPAIILEFIGGEPLLEIKQTRLIYEYFLKRCYELDHPWFTLHRISLCSNGMQYFDKDVQDFFKDYASQISFNISIDGNKELHDACRVQPNGEGSYDIDMVALNHYNKHYSPERNSKITLAPANILHLYDSVVDFIDKGMTVININCVFEEGWTPETAHIEYTELKRLADYILENDLEHLYIAIFNERQEDRMPVDSDGTFCGGNGAMLAMRPNGQFYPCIRYMPTSVGDNVEDLCIGTVDEGIVGREDGSPVLEKLDTITRRSQTNDICFECPLSNDCASCLALGHTVFGTPNKRTTFTCVQVIAEALANVYYWNALAIKHPEYHLKVRKNVVPDVWAKIVIDEDELDYLKKLEAYSMIVYMENE